MLDACYEHHARQMTRYAKSKLATWQDAEDCVQEAFAQALRYLPAWQERGYPVSALVWRILKSRVVDARRYAARRPTFPLHTADEAWIDAPDVAQIDAVAEARALLARMLPAQRRACWLHYGLGLGAGYAAWAWR